MRTDNRPSNPRSILLIRLSSLGDIILSSALPRILRQRNPDAQIHVLCAAGAREVFEHSPHVDRVIDYHRDGDHAALRQELLAPLDGQPFDVILDLQNNRRSKRVRRGLGRRIAKIKKFRSAKLHILWTKNQRAAPLPPVPERYLATAAAGEQQTTQSTGSALDDGKGLELWLASEKAKGVYPPDNKTLSEETRKETQYVGLAPGARHKTKRWPAERFAETARKLLQSGQAQGIVLLGGPPDAEILDEFRRNFDLPEKLIDAGNAQTLAASLRAIDSCKLVISNDSAVAHMAAARRVPVVSIFGSTSPAFGFAPYRTEFRIVQQELDCRPCTHIGRAECPRGHFRCMLDTSADQVLQAAWELIGPKAAQGTNKKTRPE